MSDTNYQHYGSVESVKLHNDVYYFLYNVEPAAGVDDPPRAGDGEGDEETP